MKRLVALFLLLTAPAMAQTAQPVHYDTPLTLHTAKSDISLKVQLARTEAEQMTGMMMRKSVGADEGMLFLFPDLAPRAFWMKNTLIPLDMIFIGNDGAIVSVHRMAIPGDLTPIPSEMPARAVLEVAGGQADKWGLKVGDTVSGASLH